MWVVELASRAGDERGERRARAGRRGDGDRDRGEAGRAHAPEVRRAIDRAGVTFLTRIVLNDPSIDAGRALARGEPLRALSIVGRVDTAVGLMLRGIAYAQIGDLELARDALVRARALTKDRVTRARARAALVEIELETGEPAASARAARVSADELETLGDRRNAAMQRLVLARAEVLLGRLDEARRVAKKVVASSRAPDVRAIAWLAQAEIAIRSVSATDARDALSRARACLEEAPNPMLARALVALEAELSLPIARIQHAGALRDADLYAIEASSSGEVLLVDACRRLAFARRGDVSFARRPVLFAILLVLARAWPASVPRDALAAKAFDVRRVNDSHRMRLRVEVGRLRKELKHVEAEPIASDDGYRLASTCDVAVLLPPDDDDATRVALLLRDGAAWSVRGLAEHAGVSKSTAQRALDALVETGGAVRSGRGKDVRYTHPGTPIASRMLLLGLVPKP